MSAITATELKTEITRLETKIEMMNKDINDNIQTLADLLQIPIEEVTPERIAELTEKLDKDIEEAEQQVAQLLKTVEELLEQAEQAMAR